jgi:hypothetical protein
MKTTLLAAGILLMVATGCMGPKLPEKRPADFRINSYDGGGMNPESEEYFITNDSAGRVSHFDQSRNRWTFKPDPATLDAFYARIRELNPTTLKARDEGEVYDRGGTTLQIQYDRNTFNISDAGNSFIVERDVDRFWEVNQAIVAFVEEGLDGKRVSLQVRMDIRIPDTALTFCSIMLNQEQILPRNDKNPTIIDPESSKDMLPGEYMLNGWATVSGKNFSFYQPIPVNAEKHSLHFTIKSDTFEFQQE